METPRDMVIYDYLFKFDTFLLAPDIISWNSDILDQVLLLQNHADDASVEDTKAQGGEFTCELPCKYKAKSAWNLQRHQTSKQGCIRLILSKNMATQTVDRGIVLFCDHCGENVGRADKLRSHLKNNLCLSKHSCAVCPQKFSTSKLLREHKKNVHK